MDSLARELAELRGAVRGASQAASAGRELVDVVQETIRVLRDAVEMESDDSLRLHVRAQLRYLSRATSQA
eukprot:1952838-Alexandrium_andersonii.AAC.1